MSFAYKTLKGSDTTQAPYIANKQYSFPSNSLSSSGIVVYTGEYDPQYIISGTVYNAFDPQDDPIDNGYYRRFIFDSIQKLYYENYISGSQSGSFFVSSAYDNYDQTTLASGAFNGAVEKILSTDTSSLVIPKIRVISIPQDIYGNGIQPNTFIISSSTYYIKDDGQGNLYDYLTSGSIYNKDPYSDAYYAGVEDTKIYIGNIVYSPGFAIITNPDYLCFYPSNPVAKNDNYVLSNVSASKVLPVLLNDYDDCKELDIDSLMTYPLPGYTFPDYTVFNGEIRISSCSANNRQVTPGTYKLLYTVNNTEGLISNYATCSLTLYNNVFTSSLISYTSGCFADPGRQHVTFSLNEGVPPYSWSLDNITWHGFTSCSQLYQPTVVITVPTADNVTVYLQDSVNTMYSYSLDTQLLPIVPNSSHLDTCLNQSTGWISASATGGNPTNALSASIQSGSYNSGYFPLVGGTYVFTGLNSGSYTVTWKDNNNCTTSSTEVITTPPPINISLQAVEADCPSDSGGPVGGIAVTVTGGSGLFNYRWWDGSSFVKFVEDPTGLTPGTYNLYVSDSTGCNSATSSNIVVGSTTAIGFTSPNVVSPLCYGNGNGSITGGTLTGGSGSLVPVWNGPGGFTSNSIDIINLSAGDYYLTASDTVTGCYHVFGPYTITSPAEFKSSSFGYVGGGGTRTFRAGFTGGTTPWTASLYLSTSVGLIFVTSSSGSGPGTIPMIPNVCLSSSTYWVLDAYDANGCHMTNYDANTTLFLPAQVTQQQPVCYSTGATDVNVCGCHSGSNTTFYISASDTTNDYALQVDYINLIASGTLVYEDCQLTSLVPSGSYFDGDLNIVDFSGVGAGTVVSYDPCGVPVPKQVSIYIKNGLAKTTSTTSYSTTFESTNPNSHTVYLPSFNMQATNYYPIAQAGYIDFSGTMQQALAPGGCCNVSILVTSGSGAPDSTPYDFFTGNSAGETFPWTAYGLFIASNLNYNVNITFTSAYSCI